MAVSCDRIVGGLKNVGITVDVVHFVSERKPWSTETKQNGLLMQVPVAGEDTGSAMNQLWVQLSQQFAHPGITQPTHVVIFGGYYPFIAGPIFSAWLQVPLITLIRGNDFDSAIFSPKRRPLLIDALQRSERVCVVSRDKVDKIKRYLPNAQVEWICNGIACKRWQPLPSDMSKANQICKQKQATKIFGIIGHIKDKKGADFFIDCLLSLKREIDIHLLLVGSFEETLLATLPLDQSEYTLITAQSRYQLIPYYLSCDFICIPSLYDGTPNVMLEALALGIPLLASTAGGMGDLLVHRKHGFLFSPHHVAECQEAILAANDIDEAGANILGENCLQLARTKLDVSREINSYRRMFQQTKRLMTSAQPISTETEAIQC